MAEALKLSDPRDAVIGSSQIQARVKELGIKLAETYAGDEVTMVTVLKGAIPFERDLRHYALQANTGLTIVTDTMRASSYHGAKSTGEVSISKKPEIENIKGKKVVLVEDIQDSRLTIAALCQWLKPLGPESLEVYAYLDKPNAERVAPAPEGVNVVTGIEIDNRFVVGYGLDLDGKHRELPFITVCDQITPELWTPRYLEEPASLAA